jgi:GTP-binding protein LepA
MTDGRSRRSTTRAFLPEVTYIEAIEEPMVKAFVITPNEYIGDMMNLISEKRGAIDTPRRSTPAA